MPGAGSNRSGRPPAQITNPPYSAAATLSGCPSISAARSNTGASSSYMWSAATRPATIAAPLDPSPAETGICELMRNDNPSDGCRASNARTHRLVRSLGRSASPASTLVSPVSSTSSSSWMASAAAIESKPGPRLADDAGTRTMR